MTAFSEITAPCKAFCIVFLLAILAIFPVRDANSAETPNQDVKTGVFNFAGYHSKDKNGNLTGYGIDLLKLLSEYSHLNFIPKGYDESWQRMQEMVKNGEIDIVSSARRIPEREELFTFSLPVGRNNTILSKKMRNTKLRAGDYATYDGMKVGVLAGSSQNEDLKKFASLKKFDYTPIEYDSPEVLAKALQQGDVDAILTSNLRKPVNEVVLDIIRSDNFYIIARKNNQALIDEINNAIEQINQNEGDWQNDLYYRHYGPELPDDIEFSPAEKEYIAAVNKSGKPITAISHSDIAPYSYVENGELKGILPDYFARLMKIAGLPFQFIAPRNHEDYIARTEANEADVVLDTLEQKPIQEGEALTGFITQPFLTTGLARVTRMDFQDEPQSIAIANSEPASMHGSLLKDPRVRLYPTAPDALNAVRKGEVDAAYVLPLTAQLFVSRDPGGNLVYAIMDEGGASFSLGTPTTGDHELITILKKAIKELPAGTVSQLSSNYVSLNAHDMSVYHYLYANPRVFMVIAGALMLGLSMLTIIWLRGRWSRRLLAITEQTNRQLEEQLAIVETLSRDYANVLAVNPDCGMASVIKIGDYDPWEKVSGSEKELAYDQVVTTYISQKVHPEDREHLAQALNLQNIRKVLAGSDEFSETYRILENGEIKYFQFTFVRAPESSGNLILAGFRNIDDVMRREQEQKKALAEALAQSRYASAAKTAFLNNMSHDIRTPMNAIIGFTALASSNVENIPVVKRYLGKIMTSGNHLLSLINDVLDMSRIESGKVKIREQAVRLPEILHDLRTIVQADIKSKQLDFQIDTLNVVNETILCDRLRLNQVLLNILSNAMKYTRPGGKVSVRVIQLGAEANGKVDFEFRVADTGIGMSEEFLKHVFEPFEREQTATVSGIQGTGLGLAITKNIVDIMGGQIKVQSEQGKGSEFTVKFSFKVPEDSSEVAVIPQYAGVPVLVVDDDINTCTSLGKMLSQLGMRPDWTTLGKEALVRSQFASDQAEAYGVYFIDWIMADMNGIELARRLRKKIPPETPIILMTAYDWSDIEEEGKEAGITAYLSKPVFLSDLRNILTDSEKQLEEVKEEEVTPEIFQGKRILLAEDNEMNQEIAQMVLENAGFELDIVENGQEALEKISVMPPLHYHLILMDVQMPVMNGYDATRAIRELPDPLKANLPIIAMTANAFEEDREEAVRAGMNGYIPKPIDIKSLLATLEEILKKDRTQAR